MAELKDLLVAGKSKFLNALSGTTATFSGTVTAPTFKGSLDGNASTATSATTATKATQDGSGNVITSTYAIKNHASTATTYGVGDANHYGHVILYPAASCTSFTSDSGGALTPAAAKKAVTLFTNDYAPTKTGTGASGTWGISITGNAATATSATSASSATIANRLALNGISNDTTYGTYAGIIQNSSTGPVSGQWHNTLRVLHNNSTGYFTDIAVNFTGTEGMWFRSNRAGTIGAWRQVATQNFDNTFTGNNYFEKSYGHHSTASYRTTASNSGYYQISINSANAWMTAFTIRLYQNYKYSDIVISGYNYGSNYWYSPAATMIASSTDSSIDVKFGYTSASNLWVAIPAGSYTGLDIIDVVNGYNAFDSYKDLFTITHVASLSGTTQSTVTCYRPWYRNETVSNATNAATATNALACSGNAATATKFNSARSITLSGDVSGTASADGSSGWSISTTVADNSHRHSYLSGWADTRAVTTTPNDYNGQLKVVGIKQNATITIDGSNYSTLVGIRGWTDSSGGNAHELAFTGNGNLYHRHGSTTAWNAWNRIPMCGTANSFTAANTFSAGLTVSGRVNGSGDDEGIIVGAASNGYAGLCLGSPSGRRSVFYMSGSGTPFWRYNDTSASYDLKHPGKGGTIATTGDLSSYLPLSGGTMTGSIDCAGTDINLKTPSSSSNDSSDLVYYYGNGTEKARIWTQDTYASYSGPNWRVYDASGNSLGSGHLWASGESITGAVWNDYAECRESDCEDFGYVLMENGNDSLSKTETRLSHFAGVSSDTWGFSQGETEKAKTPIAVAGRVLVYTYQDRNNYKPGDCVCAAPGGTVDIMTREEVIYWPDRIVGTVSCVPDYEEWGGGDRPPVKVNGRIWIKVK